MTPNSMSFFQKADWVGFYVTSLLAFAVYLFTLSPENDLNFSGIFATSAMYLGVSNPPAYPVWTVYSFLFVKLLPIFNIAWRVGVATAFASALTCGLIALMVSRIGLLAAENTHAFTALSAKEQTAFRIVCGAVAGLGLGLDGCYWNMAVVANQWNFNVFLFALTLCLLSRWFFAPEQKRYLYLAALMQGLILSDSQALFPTALALPFLVALGNPNLGRQIFFLLTLSFWSFMALNDHFYWFEFGSSNSTEMSTHNFELGVTMLVMLVWIILWAVTRKFFSEWKTTILCVCLLLAGISTYFLLSIFSMADPPMNWGYPRTVEGFFHVAGRGQYGKSGYVENLQDLLIQWTIYGKIAKAEFGIVYLAAALIPLFFLHKMPLLVRKWILGLVTVWFLISQLMLMALNLSPDKSTYELNELFFSATHFVLALLAGCGFMLAGVRCVCLFRAHPAGNEIRA
ncbi:MAG TPA: DUF2723 domain-containing protein [Verrucomicrobiae bacterium]